jgi:hypothetical protein
MEVIHEGKKIMGYNSMKFKIAQQEIKSKNIFQKHKYIYIYARYCAVNLDGKKEIMKVLLFSSLIFVKT